MCSLLGDVSHITEFAWFLQRLLLKQTKTKATMENDKYWILQALQKWKYFLTHCIKNHHPLETMVLLFKLKKKKTVWVAMKKTLMFWLNVTASLKNSWASKLYIYVIFPFILIFWAGTVGTLATHSYETLTVLTKVLQEFAVPTLRRTN